MKITLRPIKKSDNSKLSQIIKATFDEFNAPRRGTVYSDPTTNNLYELFQNKRSACWVAKLNGKIVGLCGIYPTKDLDADTCELVKFYLAPHARGLGIGKHLIYQCEASAIDLGYQKIYLESLPQFENALHMYLKVGYKEVEKSIGDSGHTGCTIFMLKELKKK
jgi:putative acetyltransferase